MTIISKAMKNQNLFNTVAYFFGHNLLETEMDEIIKAVNLDTNDLKDHRIETLETQVKDLQEIKQGLQNKLLNSEKVIISKNSHLKVCDRLLDNYRNSDFKLKVELKYKDSEIDKLQNRIESLKGDIFIILVITSILFVCVVCLIIKQSL